MDALQLIGSLVAILALAGLAAWMKLGGQPALQSEDQAREAAGEAVDGYTPVRIAIDGDGRGALLEDGQGRLLLLKLHGNRFAGRLLAQGASAVRDADLLTIDSGERRYGKVTFALDDSAYWESAINRLRSPGNA